MVMSCNKQLKVTSKPSLLIAGTVINYDCCHYLCCGTGLEDFDVSHNRGTCMGGAMFKEYR